MNNPTGAAWHDRMPNRWRDDPDLRPDPLPRRPDGSLDVVAYGRMLDAWFNRGAGAPR